MFARRLSAVALPLAAIAVVFSCSGEPTRPVTPEVDPGTTPVTPPVVVTGSLRFDAAIPELVQSPAFGVASIDRAHVVLRRASSSTPALDTAIVVQAGARTFSGTFAVRLAQGTNASGEAMTLELEVLDLRGTVLFRAGPLNVVVTPVVAGQAPAPIPITALYAGPGASATMIKVSPRTLSVSLGEPFTFAAAAYDAGGAVIASAPMEWLSLDAAMASMTTNTAGTGKALNQRGTARIVARLVTGQADTVVVNVSAKPASIAAVSGDGQRALVGKASSPALANPLVVKVLGADSLPLANAAVTFATQDGGTITPATTTTDANGVAQASWTLGNVAGTQRATARADALPASPVTFSAVGETMPATHYVFRQSPAIASWVPESSPFTIVVAALDADGDVDIGYTSPVRIQMESYMTGQVLVGPTIVNATAGLATFNGMSVTHPGNVVLAAYSADIRMYAHSDYFVVTPAGSSATIRMWSQDNVGGLPGALLPWDVYVRVYDGPTHPKVGAPVTFTVATGGGTVTRASTVTDSIGLASTGWRLGPTAGWQTLTVSSPGAPSITASALAYDPLNRLEFRTTVATPQVSGRVFAPPVVVEVRDPSNALVTSFNGPVSIVLDGSSIYGAHLDGRLTVNAVNGVATFDSVLVNPAGGFKLLATSTGMYGGYSSGFTVVPGPAARMTVVSGGGQTARANTLLPSSLVLKVTDAFGNDVPGVTVSFTVNSGGVVTPATAVTGADGNVVATWRLGALGTQSVVASAAGTSPVTITATAADPPLGITGQTVLGARQRSYFDNRVSLPTTSTTPVVVNLESLDTLIATVPASVTIPAGYSTGDFIVTSRDVTGTAQIRATAAGYLPATTSVRVTQPRFRLDVQPNMGLYAPRQPLMVYPADANGDIHESTQDVVVTLATTTPGVISIDVPSVKILAGMSYSNTANVSPIAAGHGIITASDARTATYAYVAATAAIDVITPAATLGFGSNSLGLDQYANGSLDIGYAARATMTTPITHSAVPHTVANPASAVHQVGQSVAYLELRATSPGVDTLTAAPAGQSAVRQVITVGDGGFWCSMSGGFVRVGDAAQVFFQIRSPGGFGGVYAAVPTTLTLVPSAGVTFAAGAPAGTPATMTLPVGTIQSSVNIKGVTSGPASIVVSAPNYTTYTCSFSVAP